MSGWAHISNQPGNQPTNHEPETNVDTRKTTVPSTEAVWLSESYIYTIQYIQLIDGFVLEGFLKKGTDRLHFVLAHPKHITLHGEDILSTQ